MRPVLVTAATTPTGQAIVRTLLADRDVEHVLGVAADPESAGLADVHDPRFTYARFDITRHRELRSLLFGLARSLEIDTVVHCAPHRSAMDRGSRIHALNVESTRALLELSEEHPTVSRFVFRSAGEVYAVGPAAASVIDEDHPLDLDPRAPQWVRDRVEADLTVCARMGMSRIEIVVMRFAECPIMGIRSQLLDYLGSRVCLVPMGYDPMLNCIAVDDLAEATRLAVRSDFQGVLNIPGRDTLPLSEIIWACGRRRVPVPGPLLAPAYRWRSRLKGTDFRYDLNRRRFHFGCVLSGLRAKEALGYEPAAWIDWARVLGDGARSS